MKSKRNQGITLIALIISIIVLLILVAISISTIIGENGILTKVNDAKKETEREAVKEKVQIAVLGSYGTDGEIDAKELIKNLGNLEGINQNTIPNNPEKFFPWEVTVDDYKVIITEEGKVIKVIVESKTNGGEENPPVDDEPAIPGELVIERNKTYTNQGTAIIPVGFAIVPRMR